MVASKIRQPTSLDCWFAWHELKTVHQKTHDQIATELRSQLKTVAACLSVAKLPPFVSGTSLRDVQRVGAQTFASQLWLCEREEEVRKLVGTNRAAAEMFYPLAAFAVELFIKERDLTRLPFSGWGHFAMLSDAVTIYLKEVEGGSRNGRQA